MRSGKWSAVALGILMIFSAGNVLAQPVEIHWWHAMRSARGEVCNAIIKKFNESQDKYRVIGTNKGNYDETVNAGIAAIRARKHPHLLQSFEVGTQTMMLSGAVYPVYQLMKDEGYEIDWTDYLQPVLSYYMDKDGNLMSMPFNSSTPVMYYNADMFRKAGIALLSKEAPVTWDELGEMLTKVIGAGAPGGMVTAWQSWTQVENYCAIHNLPFATKANGYEGLDCELAINNAPEINHITRLRS
ncbi:ABC transporter substrate-binding protein [Desulfonema ishimotonii]|uniref:sn-glycerol-3-phosphate-binding periplasmic protein UgpB n=1 Tax=Desulfonema ishimotonii TaxID=45657 RepID=A0A401FQL3_9BACT|nr:extracellular solute-binding protein [Desulfonema ishimotonii]GBC59273.1 ABC transporter substrate-binding protein [Desulfonema ishimotonii]